MKYKIKMTLEGAFPGSPDIDNFTIDEKTWGKIRDLIYPKFISENSIK